MKILKKTLAVAVSLALCGSMVAPAFAASFDELQGVIDDQRSLYGDDDNLRIGYDGGNVTLYEDVTYNKETDNNTTITIDKDVAIDLNGQEINGGYVKDENEGSKDSVITVENGGNLTIKDTSEEQSGKITGGNASLGNAIENNAGGGVYVDEGSLTLESGSITDNYAGKNGGGVYVGKDGSFTMNGGTIANNATENYGGGVYLNTEWSAQNNGESKFVMNGGEISGNTVGSIEQGNGGGGGIGAVTYEENQDHTQGYDSIVINGGTIKNNTAGLQGGGIAVTNGTVKINGSDGEVEISGNTAGSHGGGIYSSGSKTEISNAVISGNTAGTGGGVRVVFGDVNINNTEISGNTASGSGGGINIGGKNTDGNSKDTAVTITNSTISGNTATTSGGGIYAYSVDGDTSVEITDSTISDNRAQTAGGIYVDGRSGGSKVEFGDSAVSGNTAKGQGGGIYASGAGASIEMTDTAISGNKATNVGGGVRLHNGAKFTMYSGSITSNTSENNGGGIYSYYGTVVTVYDGVISDNEAVFGGGIFSHTATLTMHDGTISNNTSTSAGGGVYNHTGTFTMNGGTISLNESTGNAGGGVFNYNGTFALNAGEVSGNTAATFAGGVYNGPNGTLLVADGAILNNNHAGRAGDDIYSTSDSASVTLGAASGSLDGEAITGWYLDGKDARWGQDGIYTIYTVEETPDGALALKAAYTVSTEPDPTDPVDPAGPDIEVEDPDVPLGGEPEVEINDPAVPLSSGPVTRAQFVDYLWRHEGEPAPVQDNGLFEDVTEEHEYSPAMAWAKSIGIIEAYEDGTFEPDELVTVAAVREILTRFAAYADMVMPELTTLTGGDDEAVLNCDQVLAEFFGESYEVPGMEDDAA